tara:strand:+ start:38562 stop:38726 length:165 start_codon:yes stop_codon:yes gene_type:complete
MAMAKIFESDKDILFLNGNTNISSATGNKLSIIDWVFSWGFLVLEWRVHGMFLT